MVRALLELRETPESDAADALAIGLTHLFSADPLKAHMMEREIHLAVMRDERKTALAARELKFDCPALFSNH